MAVKNADSKNSNSMTKKGKGNPEEAYDQYSLRDYYYQNREEGEEGKTVRIENMYGGQRADYYVTEVDDQQ